MKHKTHGIPTISNKAEKQYNRNPNSEYNRNQYSSYQVINQQPHNFQKSD